MAMKRTDVSRVAGIPQDKKTNVHDAIVPAATATGVEWSIDIVWANITRSAHNCENIGFSRPGSDDYSTFLHEK
jgi:hypothetical protein